jgi:FAD/FMN-containing dehydrogenase
MTADTAPATLTPGQARDLAADLRGRIAGAVLTPDDERYDAARVTVYGGDTRPALIVRPVDDAEVAIVVDLVRRTGVAFAVRSGGHGAAAHGTVESGLVVDLRDLTGLELDVEARTAWVGAGLTAGEVTAAAAEHGLAAGFGDTGSVGLGGLITGGGLGDLSRKHGMTIDNLLAADVVTADGQVRRADPASHPDLFWAIRGGGSNVGIVTRFHLRLHPVDTVLGGPLVLPATAETVTAFLAACEAAPDELTVIANVMNCPPVPFLPEEVHGRLVIFATVCCLGDPGAAAAAVAPLRAVGEPIADLVRPVRYPELFPPEDPDVHPTPVGRTSYVDTLGLEDAATLVDRLASCDATFRVAQLRVLGGAIARVPNDATAYAHRASRVMISIVAFYEGEEDRARRLAWVEEVSAALPQGDTGAYVNFMLDEGPERVHAAYPGATWDRLASVKATYDPENLFRHNHNVPPATAGG